MKSWKSTLGGALSAAGSMMVGIGVVPQLSGAPNHFLTYVALIGFVLNVLGTFFAHLFAADQSELIAVSRATQEPVPTPSELKEK
jgi:hypothetical protein